MLVKSLEGLAELRRKVQEEIRLRGSDPGIKVVVGMGTCGIAAGAREVVTAILEEMNRLSLTGIAVTQTGCVGLCEYEPLVEVIKPGQPKVTYHHVDAEKARQIVAKHLLNDPPAEE